MDNKSKIAVLQPFIPHYRKEFWSGINSNYSLDMYVYEGEEKIKSEGFQRSDSKTIYLKNIHIAGRILLYSILPFLKRRYDTLILPLHFGHITTWILLFSKLLHKKRIILMGHGISIKRYLNEEKNPSHLLGLMISLSDTVWLYTNKEVELWKQQFPSKDIIAFSNTISGVEKILEREEESLANKDKLKLKYHINEPFIFIYCARFNNKYRRAELLTDLIAKLNPSKYGFIIIGDGKYKPDFSKNNNVYDFNTVYDSNLKTELYEISDLYFQPAWVGLSIVEAMAYGKPILTFKREEEILQCVEYSYLIDGHNALIANNIDHMVNMISELEPNDITRLGHNARCYVKTNLRMEDTILKVSETLSKSKV